MKILHLTFKNLNSLSGTFTIDFSEGPLAEAGIFAITGPTGAGKTTILDAITLALFGKAARYDDNKRNNPENMMSRGTGECFAEVRFECGKGIYSARWDLARARKKPDGRIQGTKRQLADGSGDILETKIRQVDEAITELTGLDYHRFLRSVLLAQGRFKEFLDAGIKDRGELLERITGTEIYSSLSILAHEAARDKEETLKEARTAANLITLLSEEEVESFAKEHAALADRKQTLEDELVKLTGRLDCHTKWVKATGEKDALKERERSWQISHNAFQPRNKELERHDTAAPLAGDVKLWGAKNDALKTLETRMAQLTKVHASARQQAANAFAVAAAACEQQVRNIENRRADGLKKKKSLTAEIGAIKEWQKEKNTDEGIEKALPAIRQSVALCQSKYLSLKEADKAKALTRKRITDLEKGMKQAELEQREAQKALEDKVAALRQVDAALAAHKPKAEWSREKEAADKIRETLQELARLNDTHAGALQEREKLQTNQSAQKAEQSRLESEAKEIERLLEVERRILGDKELIHNQALAMASLDEKRARLVPGEPCPLCGATEHPYAKKELPKPSETEANFRNQKNSVENLEKQGQANARKQASTSATLTGLDAQLKKLEADAADLTRRFSRITTGQGITAPLGDQDLLQKLTLDTSDRLSAINETLKNIEALEAQKTAAEKEQIAAKGRADAFESRASQLKETLSRENTQLETQTVHQKTLENESRTSLGACLEALSPWGLSAGTPEEATMSVSALEKRGKTWQNQREKLATALHTETKVDAGLQTLADQITRIEAERETWTLKGQNFHDVQLSSPEVEETLLDEAPRRALCEKTDQKLASVETQIKTTENDIAGARESLEAFHVELSDRLSKHGFQSIDAVKIALLDGERLRKYNAEKTELANQKVRLEALLRQTDETLAKLAEEKPPTEDEAKNLATQKGDIETDRDALLKRIGEIDAALAADRKARTTQAEQLKQIEVLEKEARPWLVLKDLIGSADGSKFSKFAQGLTLAQLVNLANHHLQTLNPRYQIQRVQGEDLELEIIDRYQADALRPTKSLSGGESFLVSLALALGLSEMAGQKTRIESLFIDEGFGSLDADTLDTALAALENLRLSNRTIGVISHVELLKSRLGTQIEVSRKADGHATLAVVDG